MTSHPGRKFRLVCVACRKEAGGGFVSLCPSCGGLVDPEYDLASVRLRDSPDACERFFDLLPIERGDSLISDRSAFTPLVHAERLGRAIGLPDLHLKNETILPTRTTKDRMARVALPFLLELGIDTFCVSSTGNSSSALARAIRFVPGARMLLFTAEGFVSRVQGVCPPQVVHYGLRGSSFAAASRFASRYAVANGLVFERGFFNPGRREGLKLAFLEAAEQRNGPFDWYVQAVSSGMGVWGTWRGALQLAGLGRLERPPRLLCVQQSSCAPMVSAFAAGSETIRPADIVAEPAGIASAILRGDPRGSYPWLRRIVLESEGSFVAVSETEIREARDMLRELEGLEACFAASTAVAGVWRSRREGRVDPAGSVLVNLTGAEREPEADAGPVEWIEVPSEGWDGERASGAGA